MLLYTTKLGTVVATALTIIAICSCVQTKITNRELFEVYIQKNIETSMQPLIDQGVDSTVARNSMTCVWETMYKIDSTFFLREYWNELDSIINKNKAKFEKCRECLPSKDSLKKALELEAK